MLKYITIKKILDDLLQHPMLSDLTLERVANYAVEFMRIVGINKLFKENKAIIKIKDHMGILPCDFERIISVMRTNDSKMYLTASSFDNNDKNILSYKIQGNIIITSTLSDDIEIVYNAIPVDDDFIPLIPDDASFIRALELYIKKQSFTILFDLGKINNQIMSTTSQEYAFAVANCMSNLSIPSVDDMEAFSKQWNVLIPRTKEHSNNFSHNGR